MTQAPVRSRHVTLIGLGNVGSQLAPLLARMPGLAALTLIDHDVYSAENLATQNITPGDAGAAKALVVARQLRAVAPGVRLRPLVRRAEEVPLGEFGCDVVVACVDSLAARLTISEAAWRRGVPLVDTGVQADGALARVTVQIPGADQPCLQCAWSERDYARIEQRYACQRSAPTFATNAPAWLGAAAASLAAAEVARLFEGDGSAAGKGLLLDLAQRLLITTRLVRREQCRFDHTAWNLAPLGARAQEISLGALFARAGGDGAALGVANRPWVAQRRCPACHAAESAWHLLGRRPGGCACGGTFAPVGFHTTAAITAGEVPPDLLAQPLDTLGFQDGDIVTLTRQNTRIYLELEAP